MRRGFLLLAVLVLFFSCHRNRNEDLARRLYELEDNDPGNSEKEPEKIRAIKKELDHWEKELNKAITAGRNTGRFYKALGLKYMDYKMFGPGVESFSKALEISPENARVLYYRGVSLGRLAMTMENPLKKEETLKQVEQDYKQAIRLEPRYMPPYLSLSILYIYEFLDYPAAKPFLETYLKVERSNGKALLLYGQLLEELNAPEKAMDQYTKLLALKGYESEKAQAEIYLERVKKEAF